MNTKSLKTLEYHKIITQLTEYASSELEKNCAGAWFRPLIFMRSHRPRPKRPMQSPESVRKELFPLEA